VLGGALLEGKYLQTYDSAFIAPYTGYGFALSRGIANLTSGAKNGIIGNAIHSPTADPSIISFAGTGTFNSLAQFFNSNPEQILIGDADTRDLDFSSINASTQTALNWSIWDSADNNTLYDNISGGFDENVFTDNLLVVTTTNPAFRSTGSYTFADTTQTRNFTATASQGNLDSLTGSFDVDFLDGSVTNGNMQLSLSDDLFYDQSWSVNFTGLFKMLLNSGNLDYLSYLDGVIIGDTNIIDNYDGGATGNEIEGDILGLLTTLTDGGPGFAGGFDLAEVDNPSNNVIGAFLWGNDNILTAEERIGMSTNSGIFVTGSAKTGDLNGIFGGPAFFNATAGEEAIVNRAFNESTFGNKLNLLASAGTVDSVFKSGNTTPASAVSSNGLDRWGSWQSATVGTNAFDLFQHAANGSGTNAPAGDFGYWFIGDPIDADDVPTTGSFAFGGTGVDTDIVDLQGSYSVSKNSGVDAPSYESINADSFSQFSFDLDFSDGDVTNGVLGFTAGTSVIWTAEFSGSLIGAFLDASIDETAGSSSITDTDTNTGTVSEGAIQGFLTGSSTTVEGAALAFNLAATTNEGGTKNALFGTVLLGPGTDTSGQLTLPTQTADEYSIAWGKWDNPIDQNWVVVTPESNGQVEILTGEHLALVTPTPIANLTGTGNYGTSIASSFIGTGSAGDVTQVVAGMAVNFETGAIADGLLQVEVANSQAWQIDFLGTVSAGLVDLNSTAGVLMDPGGIISSTIDANLGGVFTGDFGEAFVGGFELVDQINSLNHVGGIYIIER
jgi:hypothetical protein